MWLYPLLIREGRRRESVSVCVCERDRKMDLKGDSEQVWAAEKVEQEGVKVMEERERDREK